MRKSTKNLGWCVVVILLIAPAFILGKSFKGNKYFSYTSLASEKPSPDSAALAARSIAVNSAAFADMVYDSLDLDSAGLTEAAFEYAWKGYQKLLSKGMLAKSEILSICDFSQSSRKKRFYIIDLANMKLLVNTYVAHGRNSGGEYAKSFSNSPESHKSSLGFYVTRSTYFGAHGLSLKIDGVERGINDKALRRNIVVHGSEYVGSNWIENNKFAGRSYGCPAVPDSYSDEVIQEIKDGTCLFIYYPSKTYITRSRLLKA